MSEQSERRITAEKARALREAATPGPWRDDWFGQILDGRGLQILSTDEEDGFGRVKLYEDGQLIKAAPDLAASVEYYADQADRLARVLAVERGDWREAPSGWEPRGADMWVRGTRPGRPIIQRFHRDGQPTTWTRRGEIDGPHWPTALEAMEAINAAGVSNG